MKQRYTTDWFTRHIGTFTNHLGSLEKPKILEIGCYEGMATVWMLENLNNPSVTVIDTFKGSPEHEWLGAETDRIEEYFDRNIAISGKKVRKLKGASVVLLPEIKGKFDFIYVDGSHKATDVFFDGYYGWKLLKRGGLMAFDDYLWPEDLPEEDKPHLAIDLFLNEVDHILVEAQYQVWIKKK